LGEAGEVRARLCRPASQGVAA